MGFNKRYATKEAILKGLNYDYIISYRKADFIITDNWSDNFFKNINWNYKDYENTRDSFIKKYQFSSNMVDIDNIEGLDNLKYLSNILINLEQNPTWIDIILTSKILDIEIEQSDRGKFDKIVEICKESIKNKFKK